MESVHPIVDIKVPIPFAAAFTDLSDEVRERQQHVHRLAWDVFEDHDLNLHCLWRDGCEEPLEPQDILFREDILLVEDSPLLVAITGFPRSRVSVLIEIARVRHKPLLLLNWPGTPPVEIEALVLGQIEIDSGQFVDKLEQLMGVIADTVRFSSAAPLSTAEQKQLLADLRPARFQRLTAMHRPKPLTFDYLALHTGISLDRLNALALCPWDLLGPSDEELAILARRLRVPIRALTVRTDVEAGSLIRSAQLQNAADLCGLTPRERKRLPDPSYTRIANPLAELDLNTLYLMVKQAISDAAEERGEAK